MLVFKMSQHLNSLEYINKCLKDFCSTLSWSSSVVKTCHSPRSEAIWVASFRSVRRRVAVCSICSLQPASFRCRSLVYGCVALAAMERERVARFSRHFAPNAPRRPLVEVQASALQNASNTATEAKGPRAAHRPAGVNTHHCCCCAHRPTSDLCTAGAG